MLLSHPKIDVNIKNISILYFYRIKNLFFMIFTFEDLMIFIFYVQKNVLAIAIEKGNIEIIKMLLSHPKIDVNIMVIKYNYFLMTFKLRCLNRINY